MATLKLWQEGKLDIHDSVNKYLTGFPADGTTVQMLLSHRSGLSNYVHFMDRSGWNKHNFVTNADVLAYIGAHPRETRSRPPGRHFEYSNTNYALLALIIEKVSGLSYGDYLTRTFFVPLQMQDSYVFNLGDTARAMQSYYQTGRRFRLEFLDQVYGDKNVFSTVRDLYKWDQALHSEQLFSKGILDSAYAGYSFEKPGQRNYGLGWRMLMIPNGKKLIYHNGWWHGNRTVFVRMLDEDATIIALCNNDYKRIYNAKRLSDLFGDYKQGQTFDEGDTDPSDPSGNGQVGESGVMPLDSTVAGTAVPARLPVKPVPFAAASPALAKPRTPIKRVIHRRAPAHPKPPAHTRKKVHHKKKPAA